MKLPQQTEFKTWAQDKNYSGSITPDPLGIPMGRPLRILYGLDPMAPQNPHISTLKCQLSHPLSHPQGAAFPSVGVWVKEMANTSDWLISCWQIYVQLIILQWKLCNMNFKIIILNINCGPHQTERWQDYTKFHNNCFKLQRRTKKK